MSNNFVSSVFKKVKTYRQIAVVADQARISGKKIVFAMGSFDMLHVGHMLFLEAAKKEGDLLIVGIGTDKVIKKLKGKQRPIFSQRLRVAMVASLMFTDYVVVLTEPMRDQKNDYSTCISLIKPDVFVLNSDDPTKEETRRITQAKGIRLALINRNAFNIPSVSTTNIIKKLTADSKH